MTQLSYFVQQHFVNGDYGRKPFVGVYGALFVGPCGGSLADVEVALSSFLPMLLMKLTTLHLNSSRSGIGGSWEHKISQNEGGN